MKNYPYSLDDGTLDDSPLFAKQREERGWDDTECWNLDTTIAKFIYPRLEVLKEMKVSHPANLTPEEWDNILQKMINTFKNYCEEDIVFGDEEVKEGLELFSKYFTSLWD